MADISTIAYPQPRPSAAMTPGAGGGPQVSLNTGDLGTMIDGLGSAATTGQRGATPRSSAAPQALDAAMAQFNRSVNFRVDQETGHQVITIRDRATGETIRQIPPDVFLALAKHMEQMRGVLFEKVA
ncbi:MAG: hypothetical protein COW73_04665 [Nitrospirae bacterium CG18_big_fil_WC_8_21_14_2_50_70_55]|nr:flagellar protein FlaG [Deltaproteobacteria bacterium]OIP62898.1 MAG: hypothetical protein AUK30_09395 [Nitrospirae bacterium CG2_30_70_394]PIQ05793.1 MAG: hypothetical protein COW73_04665 [Nitrospirae bacterium CG18_big_fil_WC_8_21_14_2_50_70_55]PIU78612.1 MAG: hypothetical protein COS73_06690 [Nitrospirae bacterium CG06_land_8_20_14_3_00_70_43]PIW82477.1 MAG: hypothetical protein COZ96_08465 [Nitrospirae bacterium CG_4_8_14_3_um_filter_70_85]PIX82439.1 MAG: hypothetical protein COZ33_1061